MEKIIFKIKDFFFYVEMKKVFFVVFKSSFASTRSLLRIPVCPLSVRARCPFMSNIFLLYSYYSSIHISTSTSCINISTMVIVIVLVVLIVLILVLVVVVLVLCCSNY